MKKILIINYSKNEKYFQTALTNIKEFFSEKVFDYVFTDYNDYKKHSKAIKLNKYKYVIFIQPDSYDKDFIKIYLDLKFSGLKKLVVYKNDELKVKKLKNIYYQDYVLIKILKLIKLIR